MKTRSTYHLIAIRYNLWKTKHLMCRKLNDIHENSNETFYRKRIEMNKQKKNVSK